jgi:hypothetical protein
MLLFIALVIGPHRKNDGAGGHGADALVANGRAVRVAAESDRRSQAAQQAAHLGDPLSITSAMQLTQHLGMGHGNTQQSFSRTVRLAPALLPVLQGASGHAQEGCEILLGQADLRPRFSCRRQLNFGHTGSSPRFIWRTDSSKSCWNFFISEDIFDSLLRTCLSCRQ